MALATPAASRLCSMSVRGVEPGREGSSSKARPSAASGSLVRQKSDSACSLSVLLKRRCALCPSGSLTATRQDEGAPSAGSGGNRASASAWTCCGVFLFLLASSSASCALMAAHTSSSSRSSTSSSEAAAAVGREPAAAGAPLLPAPAPSMDMASARAISSSSVMGGRLPPPAAPPAPAGGAAGGGALRLRLWVWAIWIAPGSLGPCSMKGTSSSISFSGSTKPVRSYSLAPVTGSTTSTAGREDRR
mmetsp:Transcript_18704/g.40215  ORF Transcript_18704/g.40215 Transcript_18704/m.40215 type:complete len:247 (+) Transcript_18704:294-1034(+)